MTWRDDAACLGEIPELFDPPPSDTAGAEAAKAVCQTCSVTAECLADALAHETALERYLIRGGMTPDERRALHRRNTRRARALQVEKPAAQVDGQGSLLDLIGEATA